MKTKSLLTLALAALLLVAFTACRDTSKEQQQVSTSSITQSEVNNVEPASEIGNTKLPDSTSNRVVDVAGILSEKDITEITQEIEEIEGLNLVQVAVVVVNDLEGKDALQFATDIANKWGVGHKETNDGITILVKPKTGDTPQAMGKAAIAVGTGMEKTLPDDLCQRIIDEEMIPKFKQNKYGEGIEEALDRIKDILTGDKN